MRRKREARGESLESFAVHFGMSGGYVSGWEVHGKVPRRRVIECGVASLGEDLATWLREAGITDELGGILGEKVSALQPDPKIPIVGTIGEHGIIQFHPEAVAALEGNVRFALRVATSSPGALLQAGDVVHFETCETAKRNDHVLIEEADGTHRLVRLVNFDAEARVVKALPVDAPALPKAIRIEAKVIARLIALQKF